jgi:MFS family permease
VTFGRGVLLGNRNFRLLWVGETISVTGTTMSVVVVPLLMVTVLRASTFAVASASSAATLPWLLIGLPAGAWVDRLPVRRLMIACDLVEAVVFASVPAAAWCGVLTVAQVMIVAFLAGTADVLFSTAYQVFLPRLVRPADLVEGNAKLQGSASVARIAGRGCAGLVVQVTGAAPAVLFNVVSFMVSAACLLRIREDAAPPLPPPPGPGTARRAAIRTEVHRGARFIATDPYLRPLTAYAAVSNFGYAGSMALMVIFLVRVAGFGAGSVGVLLGIVGCGGVVGAALARRLSAVTGTARALLLASLGAGGAEMLLPFASTGPRAALFVTGAALLGAGIVVGNIIAASFRQAYCPPEMLGRVVSGMRFVAFGSAPLGALLAGVLGTAIGIRNGLWILLAIDAAAGLLLLTPAIASRRDLPADRVPTVNPGHATVVG